jgi:hypothetical protein
MQAASVLSNCLRDGSAAITAPGVESMAWKSQGEPAQRDIFLTFATINSFPMKKE